MRNDGLPESNIDLNLPDPKPKTAPELVEVIHSFIEHIGPWAVVGVLTVEQRLICEGFKRKE